MTAIPESGKARPAVWNALKLILMAAAGGLGIHHNCINVLLKGGSARARGTASERSERDA